MTYYTISHFKRELLALIMMKNYDMTRAVKCRKETVAAAVGFITMVTITKLQNVCTPPK